jgi:hypothetical protein
MEELKTEIKKGSINSNLMEIGTHHVKTQLTDCDQ